MKVILLMALTADGISAKHSSHLVDWTCEGDKKFFVETTKKAGVMIMGSKTYDTIGRPLPGRESIVYTRNKERVSDQDNLTFTDMEPEKLLESLRRKGYSEVVLIGGATVNTLFAEKKLIDEIYITYEPKVFGCGLPLFQTEKELDLDLTLKEIQRLDENSFYVIYGVKNKS